MSETRSLALAQAYELIESGKPEEARAILEPMLAQEKNNADAWWIYAHAVDDPVVAREALRNVLRLDPHYPGAAQLEATLNEQFPESLAETEQIETADETLAETAEAAVELPAQDEVAADEVTALAKEPEPGWLEEPSFDEPAFDEPETPTIVERPAKRRSVLLLAAAIALVLVLLAVVLIALPSLTGAPPVEPQPTSVAAQATPTAEIGGVPIVPPVEITEEPVEATPTSGVSGEQEETPEGVIPPTVEVEATAEPLTAPTQEAEATEEGQGGGEPPVLSDAIAQVAGNLGSISLAQSGVRLMDTELGETVTASVCTAPGVDLRVDVVRAMTDLAQQVDLLSSADALGVEMIACDINQPLRLIVTSIADARAFAAEEIDAEAFAARWRSL